jgi:hypothetical protein
MDLPPPFRDQRKADGEQLNLLATFHFVGAGLAVVGMLFLCAHYAMMSTVFANPQTFKAMVSQGGAPGQQMPPTFPGFPPAQLFAILKWFYVIGGVWLAASCVLNILSGCWLRARRNRNGSIVVGVLNCLHIPLGTVLGIFTIVILSRPSVRQLYGE